jgi:two-component system, OmpR family, sensor histidine kinase KdpD
MVRVVRHPRSQAAGANAQGPSAPGDAPSSGEPSFARRAAAGALRRYAEALLVTAACTGLAWALDPVLETPNLGLVFLTGVLLSAARGGVGPALFASVLSALVFNFLLTEPRYTLRVSAAQDSLTLVFFLIVSLVTGQLAARARSQIETIRANSARTTSLEHFSRRLTGIVSREDFARVLREYLGSVLNLDATVLLPDAESRLVAVIAAGDVAPDITDTEREAAKRAFSRREPTGRGTTTLSTSPWLFVPLFARDALGVVAVRDPQGRPVLDTERRQLLFAMRDQASTALDRVQLAAAMERSRLFSETDKLRAALLSSVSHDLRTPLVSIKGATTALLDLDATLSAADKRELLENVLEETERLNRYVQNLLDMTRLGYGAVTPQGDWRDVREIIGSARRALKRSLEDRAVNVDVPSEHALIHTDAALLERILVNLLENAARYSPPGTRIDVDGRAYPSRYELTVSDRGPGIPRAERDKVFDLFTRARVSDRQNAGTGMGLSICRGFAEALGGTLRVGERPEGPGALFRLSLPQPARAALGAAE